MTAYPNLLRPLKLGNVTLPNRMVMGAMHTRLETLDRLRERLAAFYAARARRGWPDPHRRLLAGARGGDGSGRAAV